jgi:glycosyltransferase involved in cell wall biosynthesis
LLISIIGVTNIESLSSLNKNLISIFSKSNYISNFICLAALNDPNNDKLQDRQNSSQLEGIILSVAENFKDIILVTSIDETSKTYASLMKLIWGSKVFISLDENLQNIFEWTEDNKIIFDGAIVHTEALKDKFEGILIANFGDENKLSEIKNSKLFFRSKLENILYGTKSNQFISNIFEKYRHYSSLENENSINVKEKFLPEIRKEKVPVNLELNRLFKKSTIFIFDGKCAELDSLSSSISTIQLIKALKKLNFNVSLASDDELMWQGEFLMFKSLNINLHVLNTVSILDILSNINESLVIIFRNINLANEYSARFDKLANANVFYFGHAYFDKVNGDNNSFDKKLIDAQNQLFEKLSTYTFPSTPEINLIHKYFTINKKFNKRYKNLPEFIASSPGNNHIMFSRTNKNNNILIFSNLSFYPNIQGLRWFLSECFPKIIDECQGVKLIIATPDNLPNIDNILNENVSLKICKTRQDLEKAIIESKITIWPSSYKFGPSFFIYESMKQGLPCVSNALGSTGFELASKLGALKSCNGAQEFTESVIELLSNESTYKKISNNAIEFSENFNSLFFFQEKLNDHIFNFLIE